MGSVQDGVAWELGGTRTRVYFRSLPSETRGRHDSAHGYSLWDSIGTTSLWDYSVFQVQKGSTGTGRSYPTTASLNGVIAVADTTDSLPQVNGLLRTGYFRGHDSVLISGEIVGSFSGDSSVAAGVRVRFYVELVDSSTGGVVQRLGSFEIRSGSPTHMAAIERMVDLLSGSYYVRLRLEGDSVPMIRVEHASRYPVGEVLGYVDEDHAMGKRTGMLAGGVGAGRLRLTAQPDPITDRTELRYSVPRGGIVSVRIYDMFGRTVAEPVLSGWRESGRYSEELDGVGLPPGFYVVELQVGDQRVVRRVMVVR